MELLFREWGALVNSARAADLILTLLRLTLIGAGAHLVLSLMRRPAAHRHLVAMLALGLMLATPGIALLGERIPALRIPVPAPPAIASRSSARVPGVDAEPGPRAAFRTRKAPALSAVPEMAELEVGPSASTSTGRAPLVLRLPEHPPARPLPWSWPGAALVVAIAGAIAMLAARLLAALCCGWVARDGEEVGSPRLLARFAEARATLDVPGPVALRLTDRLEVPAVAGIVRPVLLLPHAALRWSDARLRPVLLHELAHVQRRDVLTFALARLATAFLWFHPLVWTLARAARQECERACDDAVLRAGVRPSEYADQLLAIARGARDTERRPAMSLAFARPSHLEGRLLSILRPGTRHGALSRRATLGLTFVLFVLLLPIAAIRVVAAPVTETRPAERSTRVREAARATTSTSTSTSTCTREETRIRETTRSAGDTRPITDLLFAGTVAAGDREWMDLGRAADRTGGEWFSFARDEYMAKHFDTAGEAYERAALAGHREAISWYNAACCYSLDGQKNRAIGALHEAIRNGFDDAGMIGKDDDLIAMRSDRRFQMMLDSVRREDSGGQEENAEKAEAKTKRDAGDRETWLDIDSRDPRELRSAGIHLLRSGDPKQAAEAFRREYAIDSTSTALYNIACSWAVAGDKSRALDALERSVLTGYGSYDKLTGDDDLGSLHHEARFDHLVDMVDDIDLEFPSGDWNGSENVEGWRRLLPRYQQAVQKYPDVGRAWFSLGFAQLRVGDLDGSRKSFQRALDLGYRRGTSSYNLACVAAQAGDRDEALRRLQAAEAAGMNVADAARSDDDLRPLRKDSRFRDLIDRSRDRQRRERDRDKDKSIGYSAN